MKLAKLSLATIVAVGAMTTIANATPLEEAIKGVEINGFVRYRFQDFDNDANTYQDMHRFTAVGELTIPVAENLKAGVTAIADGQDHAENAASATHASGSALSFDLEKAWFQYGVDGFTAKVGKFEILSPWTDPGYLGAIGDGVLAMYSGVPGWTFAGAAFVNTNLDPSVAAPKTGFVSKLSAANINIGQENLYALAAIGAFGPVNLQVWGASMEHVFDYTFFGDAQFNLAGFSLQAQVSTLKLADEIDNLNLFADDSGIYFGVKAGYEVAGFSIDAGYTKNDKDQPIYTLSNDDSSGYIFYGKQLGAVTVNTADAQVIFGDIAYEINKFNVGAGYGYATAYDGCQKAGKDDLAQEWYVEAGYAYSKNFKLSAYYSALEFEEEGDNNEIRFEAKYSF